MKESFILNPLRREPFCRWHRSLWSFGTDLLSCSRPNQCSGNLVSSLSGQCWEVRVQQQGREHLFAPCVLQLQREPPSQSSLCPCWGWCWAWHSKFPVRINSGACPVQAVRIWWTLWENNCWLCVFSFFISAYHMVVRDTATCCVGKVSLEIWSKWEEGITKSILFL